MCVCVWQRASQERKKIKKRNERGERPLVSSKQLQANSIHGFVINVVRSFKIATAESFLEDFGLVRNKSCSTERSAIQRLYNQPCNVVPQLHRELTGFFSLFSFFVFSLSCSFCSL